MSDTSPSPSPNQTPTSDDEHADYMPRHASEVERREQDQSLLHLWDQMHEHVVHEFSRAVERIEDRVGLHPSKRILGVKEGVQKKIHEEREKLDAIKEELQVKVRSERAKLQARVKATRRHLQRKVLSVPTVMLMDRICFTLGILNVVMTEFVLLKRPQWMGTWYTLWVFPLLLFRFMMYHRVKWHYYLLDFCYFVQLLTLFYLHLYPVPQLFVVVFVFANGPLLVAIVAWRNAMVFHSPDKMTSLFIHVFPAAVTFTLRWLVDDGARHVCPTADCAITHGHVFKVGTVVYLFWQMCYYMKTEYIDNVKLSEDDAFETGGRYWIRWAQRQKPGTFWYRLINVFGTSWGPIWVFMISQLVYTMATFLPVKYMWENMWVHAAVFGVCLLAGVWNGASYYMVRFSHSYQRKIEKTKRKQEELQRRHELRQREKMLHAQQHAKPQGEAQGDAQGDKETARDAHGKHEALEKRSVVRAQ